MTQLWRVAAGQLSACGDVDENARQACELISRAADAGVRFLVLPEATMASFETKLAPVAEPLDGPFAARIARAAEAAGLTVCVGMFEPAEDGRVYNTLLVTGPGARTAYRKIHLYDAFTSKESATVAPGTELVTADVDGVRVGFATCYDVRFPEQFTELARQGAQVIALPASWGDGPGKQDQWDLLVRARAADAQAWVIAAGQAWQPGSVKAPLGVGRSAVCDPTGAVRARLGGSDGLLVTDIDLDLVAATRRQVPQLGLG